GQTRTVTKDPQGHIASIVDAANQLSTYSYYPDGTLKSITDPQGHAFLTAADLYGRKISTDDPDLGQTSYVVNSFGETVSQTDAKNVTTITTYDALGRTTQQTAPNDNVTWTYDNPQKGTVSSENRNNYAKTYTYDAQSRLTGRTHTYPGGIAPQTFTWTYDQYGNPNSMTYPNGFALNFERRGTGELRRVKNAQLSTQVFWEARNINDWGEVYLYRNLHGKLTTRYFDTKNGRTTRIYTPGIQDLRLQYDPFGNLTQRLDHLNNATENLTYDNLNRILATHVVGQSPVVHTYDVTGNLTYRSDVGCYEYPTGRTRKHAVSQLKDAQGNPIRTFSYDANGNMTDNGNVQLLYSVANQPYEISRNQDEIQLNYDAQGQRAHLSCTLSNGTNYDQWRFGDEYEIIRDNVTGQETMINSIVVKGQAVVTRHQVSGQSTVHWRVNHFDHLGSLQTITDENENLIETNSYNSWGERRNGTTWAPDPNASSVSDKGYTAHRHLEIGDFIHMQGRVYDPTIGRMMQADPFVTDPSDPLDLNRYSYVRNNPLRYTDPSGFNWLDGLADIAAGWGSASFDSPVGDISPADLHTSTGVTSTNAAANAAHACTPGGFVLGIGPIFDDPHDASWMMTVDEAMAHAPPSAEERPTSGVAGWLWDNGGAVGKGIVGIAIGLTWGNNTTKSIATGMGWNDEQGKRAFWGGGVSPEDAQRYAAEAGAITLSDTWAGKFRDFYAETAGPYTPDMMWAVDRAASGLYAATTVNRGIGFVGPNNHPA
ncbi:MAG: RHS repeat-associated core domain-containing protein, partial [Bacteroidota bacterium]